MLFRKNPVMPNLKIFKYSNFSNHQQQVHLRWCVIKMTGLHKAEQFPQIAINKRQLAETVKIKIRSVRPRKKKNRKPPFDSIRHTGSFDKLILSFTVKQICSSWKSLEEILCWHTYHIIYYKRYLQRTSRKSWCIIETSPLEVKIKL